MNPADITTPEEFRTALDGYAFCGMSNRMVLFVTWPDGSRNSYLCSSGGIGQAMLTAKRLGLAHSAGTVL